MVVVNVLVTSFTLAFLAMNVRPVRQDGLNAEKIARQRSATTTGLPPETCGPTSSAPAWTIVSAAVMKDSRVILAISAAMK